MEMINVYHALQTVSLATITSTLSVPNAKLDTLSITTLLEMITAFNSNAQSLIALTAQSIGKTTTIATNVVKIHFNNQFSLRTRS